MALPYDYPPQYQTETRSQRRRRQKRERKTEELLSKGIKVGSAGMESGMNAYIQCMEEIVTRSRFIREFYDTGIHRFPITVVAETIGLQLRKELELIAKASLVAHRSVWAEVSLWFDRDWHAREILDKLEQVNPLFYPRPVRESQIYETGRLRAKWEDVSDQVYLTKERFIEAYCMIGNVMHAHFTDEQPDLHEFLLNTQIWDNQIHELLQMHEVFLLNSDSFCLVQMNVDGTPRWSYWEKVEQTDRSCSVCGHQLFKSDKELLCPTCIQSGNFK